MLKPASQAPAAAAAAPRRAFALDALRGLAILMMVLSGQAPPRMPAWMHHAQVPPPDFVYNPNIPGITWVDLVFPFFLFAMGAAIPLALSRRIEKGEPMWRLVATAFQRFLLLGLFAVFVEHIRPFSLSADPQWKDWIQALGTFALLFMMLMRLPDRWPAALKYAIRVGGYVGALALMEPMAAKLAGSGGFWNGWRALAGQSDIIIKILANVVLGASLVWLVSRKNLAMRLGFMGLLMAIRMSSAGSNWVEQWWSWTPAPWLFEAGMFSLLFVTIPGTVVGDMLLEWMRGSGSEKPGWTRERYAMTALTAFSFTPICLWGLYSRHPRTTFIVCAAVALFLRWLVDRPSSGTERALKSFCTWGTYWLALGLLFEPYEGGIHKDPATMSYYFVSAGLACFLLAAFTILIDVFRGRRLASLLVDSGQNPMIAYVGMAILVQPILFLTGINPLINRVIAALPSSAQPGWSFVHGAVATLLVALFASWMSRKKVYWRT
ncbi:MAG TPA: DUF5009 domain-containing protein [Armatimonadota bacterium]|jgi:predicted acyltransferase